jgi:hypothetical protein
MIGFDNVTSEFDAQSDYNKKRGKRPSMANRREFIQASIAVTAAASAAGTPAQAARSAPPHRFHKVIYDSRFAEPVRFAEAAKALGLETHAITGDMTGLWYDELHDLWGEEAVAIGGMTRHGPMFCLEMLARDHGMRLVYQAEHEIAEAEVRHTVSGALSNLKRSTGLTQSGAAWPELMARLVAETPVETAVRGRVGVVTRTPGAEAAEEPLFTWVIAPASQA